MSSLPIDVDEDTDEETIQHKEEQHSDAKDVEVGVSEKPIIRAQMPISDHERLFEEAESTTDSDMHVNPQTTPVRTNMGVFQDHAYSQHLGGSHSDFHNVTFETSF